MGWGCPAVLNVEINNQRFDNVYKDYEEFQKIYQECIHRMESQRVLFPKNIRNKLFFKELDFYLGFVNYSFDSYGHLLEFFLDEDNYVQSPIDAFQIMLTVAYLSHMIPDLKFKLGLGDIAAMWLDLEFENGKVVKVKRTTRKQDGMELQDIIDEAQGEAFVCSREELVDFFNKGISNFLIKNSKELTAFENSKELNHLIETFTTLFKKNESKKIRKN